MSLAWAAQSLPSSFERNSVNMIKTLEEGAANPQKTGLHPYQIRAVLNTKSLVLKDESLHYRNCAGTEAKPKPILIVAPTASGKSGMIVLLPYVLSSKKVIVLTPSKVISEQLAIAFGHRRDKKCFFETIGMVDGMTPEGSQTFKNILEQVKVIREAKDFKEQLGNLVIVNAQKFCGRSSLVYNNQTIVQDVESFFREFDTLIVDEAHHYPAKTWTNIVEEFAKSKPEPGVTKKIIFLTATPYKKIKGKMEFILGSGPEAKKRIAFEITRDLLEGVSTRITEFKEPEIKSITPEVVYEHLRFFFDENRKLEPRVKPQAMILIRTREEARKLVESLNGSACAGNEKFAVALLAKESAALDEFTNGEFQVGVTCGVGNEGYDNANVTVCVILRKIVKGTVLFNQFIGRCMRLRRGLPPEKGKHVVDRSMGIVLSFPKFEQRELWNNFEKNLPEDDPIEVDDKDV